MYHMDKILFFNIPIIISFSTSSFAHTQYIADELFSSYLK